MSEDVLNEAIIEPIIFKLCVTNIKYTTFVFDNMDLDWISDEHYKSILKVVKNFYVKYNKLPKRETLDLLVSKIFTVTEDFQKVTNKITTILSNNYEYDEEYLDEQILRYIQKVGYYQTIINNIDEISQNKKLDGKHIESLEKLLGLSFNENYGLDLFEDIPTYIDELLKTEESVSTGWENLDYVLNGGIPAEGKCLMMWVGETHIGKSLFLSNIAANLIKDNKFVVIISLEMSEKMYANRIVAHLTSHDINKLQYNTENIIKQLTDIKSKNKSKLVIKEYPPDSINCLTIKNYLDKLIQTTGRTPDVILVDYVNLLLPNGKKEGGTYENIGNVSKQLRALSYFYNRPVLSVTQLNRSGYKNTDAGFDNISDSMGIAFIADFISLIFQNEGDKEAGVIHNKILKNRIGGKIGKCLDFEINYSNLSINAVEFDGDSKSSELVDDIMEGFDENDI